MENFKEKFKKALEKAKAYHNDYTKDIMEEIFPELKESEDEKVRKELIDAIQGLWDNDALPMPLSIKRKDKWIAWLEKQEGCECIKKDWLEHIKQSWYKEGFIDGKYSDGTSKEWTKNDAATLKELIDFLENGTAKLQHDLTRYANWLKIQLTPIKKQGNPTDINPSEFDLRLNKLLKQFETLPKEELANSLSFYLNVVQNDGTYKPDEKQGEQKPADKVVPKFHEGEWITNGDYIWKIIEIKPLDYTLLSQDDNIVVDTISHVDEQFHSFTIQDAKDGDVLCTYECYEPKIVFILKGTPKKHYALSYHCYYNIMYPHFASDSEKGCLAPNDKDVKPATKEQRDTLMKAMTEAGYTFDFERKKLEKIQDEEYNDEDYGIDGLYHAQRILEKTIGKVDGYQSDDGILEHKCAITAVKKLYEHKPTNWSEEDESILQGIWDEILANKHDAEECEWKTYDKFLNWLKSLRPQKQWKPSEKQIDALEHFVRSIGESGYASPCDNNTKLLYSLLEQLKKLRDE